MRRKGRVYAVPSPEPSPGTIEAGVRPLAASPPASSKAVKQLLPPELPLAGRREAFCSPAPTLPGVGDLERGVQEQGTLSVRVQRSSFVAAVTSRTSAAKATLVTPRQQQQQQQQEAFSCKSLRHVSPPQNGRESLPSCRTAHRQPPRRLDVSASEGQDFLPPPPLVPWVLVPAGRAPELPELPHSQAHASSDAADASARPSALPSLPKESTLELQRCHNQQSALHYNEVNTEAGMRGLARRLLEVALGRGMNEGEVEACLCYQEFLWLARGLSHAPLPPEWREELGDIGSESQTVTFVNDGTGDTSPDHPLLTTFSQLARLALYGRQDAMGGFHAARRVGLHREFALKEAHVLQDRWVGPYSDQSTGKEYYHCSASGRSTWNLPAAAHLYTAWVADKLLRAADLFPKEAVEDAGTLRNASSLAKSNHESERYRRKQQQNQEEAAHLHPDLQQRDLQQQNQQQLQQFQLQQQWKLLQQQQEQLQVEQRELEEQRQQLRQQKRQLQHPKHALTEAPELAPAAGAASASRVAASTKLLAPPVRHKFAAHGELKSGRTVGTVHVLQLPIPVANGSRNSDAVYQGDRSELQGDPSLEGSSERASGWDSESDGEQDLRRAHQLLFEADAMLGDCTPSEASPMQRVASSLRGVGCSSGGLRTPSEAPSPLPVRRLVPEVAATEEDEEDFTAAASALFGEAELCTPSGLGTPSKVARLGSADTLESMEPMPSASDTPPAGVSLPHAKSSFASPPESPVRHLARRVGGA
mmetsp:Transcript_44314/g.141896  ORF Transcript_44314/g.141896 Transcript_44314/m.141896 type:complete len:761 (-) Transcript_44314:229-2511(-)